MTVFHSPMDCDSFSDTLLSICSYKCYPLFLPFFDAESIYVVCTELTDSAGFAIWSLCTAWAPRSWVMFFRESFSLWISICSWKFTWFAGIGPLWIMLEFGSANAGYDAMELAFCDTMEGCFGALPMSIEMSEASTSSVAALLLVNLSLFFCWFAYVSLFNCCCSVLSAAAVIFSPSPSSFASLVLLTFFSFVDGKLYIVVFEMLSFINSVFFFSSSCFCSSVGYTLSLVADKLMAISSRLIVLLFSSLSFCSDSDDSMVILLFFTWSATFGLYSWLRNGWALLVLSDAELSAVCGLSGWVSPLLRKNFPAILLLMAEFDYLLENALDLLKCDEISPSSPSIPNTLSKLLFLILCLIFFSSSSISSSPYSSSSLAPSRRSILYLPVSPDTPFDSSISLKFLKFYSKTFCILSAWSSSSNYSWASSWTFDSPPTIDYAQRGSCFWPPPKFNFAFCPIPGDVTLESVMFPALFYMLVSTFAWLDDLAISAGLPESLLDSAPTSGWWSYLAMFSIWSSFFWFSNFYTTLFTWPIWAKTSASSFLTGFECCNG